MDHAVVFWMLNVMDVREAGGLKATRRRLSIIFQEVWFCRIICWRCNGAGSALIFRIRFILYICLLPGQLRVAYIQVLKQLGGHRYVGKYLRGQISTGTQYDMKGNPTDSFIYLCISSHLQMASYSKVTFVKGRRRKKKKCLTTREVNPKPLSNLSRVSC